MNSTKKASLLSFTFLVSSFVVLWVDYYYTRRQALDFEVNSLYDLSFTSFLLSIYLFSIFTIILSLSTHFLITRYIASLFNIQVSNVTILNAMIIAKFAYVIPYLFKYFYFESSSRGYYLDEVIQFTRYTVWNDLGITNLYVNSFDLPDMLYVVLFVVCLRHTKVHRSFMLGIASYTLYFLVYLFFSVFIPLSL